MMSPDLFTALKPVLEVLTRLNVRHHVGGSIASSAFGVRRSTLAADVVAQLGPEHVRPLVEALEEEYYVDGQAVREALRRHASFNVVHLESMLKVDVFVAGEAAFDRGEMARARPIVMDDMTVPLASPEDVVLRKLQWYRLGGDVSERQWGDVVGVLAVQSGSLDRTYMDQWAAELGVADLLDRAIQEARL